MCDESVNMFVNRYFCIKFVGWYEKSVEISTLQTVLDILLKQQKELAKDVDSIAMA